MPTISVHVDEDVYAQVSALADQWDRSKSWVVSDALEPYLEHRRWMLAETARTLATVRDGTATLVDHEDVAARASARAKQLDV